MAGSKKMSEERRRMILEDPLARVLPIIAFPMIISQLVNSFYSIADTFFVSQLGTAATAAIGVNDSLTHFNQAVAQGFGAGASSYVSRLLGERKDKDASQVGSTVLLVCMAFMVLIACTCYLFMSPLVDLLGATATSKSYSMDYARFILLGAPFTGGTFVLSQLLRSEGSTGYAMMGTVSGCIVNVVLDPIFISVLGLGVVGAAVATTISKIISFAILLIPFLKKHTLVDLHLSNCKFRWSMMYEVVRMGMPTFLKSTCMSVASTVTNNVAREFGDYALASVSVANKTMKFLESIIIGFSNGIQPVVGQCWGAKKYKRVKDVFWFVVGIGGAMSIVMGGLFTLLAPNIIQMFVSSTATDELLATGTLALQTQCIVLFAHMMVMIASGVFQALGKAVNATVLAMSRSILFLIPMTIILPALFDVEGLACARAAADVAAFACAALPLLIRFVKDLNRKIEQSEKSGSADLVKT